MPNTNPSFVATADIPVSRFVMMTVNTDYGVEVADGSQTPVGISHEGAQNYQSPQMTEVGPAASAGQSCRVYGLGDTCQVEAGAAIQAGQFLKSTATGTAEPAANAESYAAIALQSVATGSLVDVQIKFGVAP